MTGARRLIAAVGCAVLLGVAAVGVVVEWGTSDRERVEAIVTQAEGDVEQARCRRSGKRWECAVVTRSGERGVVDVSIAGSDGEAEGAYINRR